MARNKKRPLVKLRVKDYLLRNPNATNVQASNACGASIRTVSMARKELTTLTMIPQNPNDHMPTLYEGKDPPKELDPDIMEVASTKSLMERVQKEINDDVTDISDMDPREMKRILSKIARSRVEHPTVRIAAIREKNRLDFETQDRHELGPGVPLTREGAVDRITLLMEAVCLDIIHEALEKMISKGVADVTTDMDTNEAPPVPPSTTESPGSSSTIHEIAHGSGSIELSETPSL